MKLRLSHLVLLIALPSVVCAGSYVSFAKEVRFVTASNSERLVVKKTHSYDLVWNKTVGKFEAKTVINGEPLIMDQPLQAPSQVLDTNRRALAI